MKCIYCDAEINDTELICPKCGKETQIVEDVSGLEDDYLKKLLEEESTDKGKKAGNSDKNKKQENDKKSEIRTYILLAIFGILVIVLAVLSAKLYIDHEHANSFDYQMQAAQTAAASGDKEKAAKHYENAILLDNTSVKAYLALADVYVSMNNLDSAEADCLQVLCLDEENVQAYKDLIYIYDQKGDSDAIMSLMDGVTDSEILDLFTGYYVPAPVVSLEGGTYDHAIEVDLSSDSDVNIYYTIDGRNPKTHGKLYTTGFSFETNGSYEVRAICVNDKGVYSEDIDEKYTIDLAAPDQPTVTPDGGEFTEETQITIQVPKNCIAYYTWDGTDPTIDSATYTDFLTVPEGNHVLSVMLVDITTDKTSEIYRQFFTYYPEDDSLTDQEAEE